MSSPLDRRPQRRLRSLGTMFRPDERPNDEAQRLAGTKRDGETNSRRIVERHVVIRDESRVREAVFYADDRPCDIHRKLKHIKGVW